jgi:hypothetical protein
VGADFKALPRCSQATASGHGGNRSGARQQAALACARGNGLQILEAPGQSPTEGAANGRFWIHMPNPLARNTLKHTGRTAIANCHGRGMAVAPVAEPTTDDPWERETLSPAEISMGEKPVVQRFDGADADSDLQRRVKSYLRERHMPNLRNLQVEAQGGVVTLRGTVNSFYEKQLSQQCCRRVAGVVKLIDAIDVALAREAESSLT